MAYVWALSLGAELFVYFWLGFDIAPKADRYFHTQPILKILGLIIGIGCPINALVRVARDYLKSEKKDDDDQRPDQHG
jgi:F0F1-type ATP synthase assembly protein I